MANELFKRISGGKRYAAGDRDTFKPGLFGEERTVEFREYQDSEGKYLRAVILGLDSEYQALLSGDAAELVISLCKDDPEERAAEEADLLAWDEYLREQDELTE